MRSALKGFQIIYAVYAFTFFLLLMLIVIPLIFLASLAGKIRGGNFMYKVCSFWADAWFFLIGIRHQNHPRGKVQTDHPVIYVGNHISYMDVPVLVKSIRQPVRVLGKVELASIPLFGYIYSKCVVMVDRSSMINRAKSVMTLKYFLKNGVSIFIFPEGTFNETGKPLKSFYDGAFRIAIETGTPIKPVLFPDTIKRLHYKSIFTINPGLSRAVFLDEISVEGLQLKDVESLKNKVFQKMEECLTTGKYKYE